jgi:hypothetical protein
VTATMVDSSDSSSISSDSVSIASSKASPKDEEALDDNASKPKNKKQKIIFDFFKIKRKRGRPKKAAGRLEQGKPKRGRPPSQPTVDPLLLASSRTPSLAIAHQTVYCAKKKPSRINWASGKNAEHMRCAVKDWDNCKGTDENGDKLTFNQFANLRGIKPNTFQKYACVDRNKRRALGSQVGTKAKLSNDEQEFIAQVTARYDRANNPRGRKETIDTMQELRPDLSRVQLANHWDHTARPTAIRDMLQCMQEQT